MCELVEHIRDRLKRDSPRLVKHKNHCRTIQTPFWAPSARFQVHTQDMGGLRSLID